MRARRGRMAAAFLLVLAAGVSVTMAETGLNGVLPTTAIAYYEKSTGWSFTPNQNIVVTKLGNYFPVGVSYLMYDHCITIYDSTGAVKVSGTIVGYIGNNWSDPHLVREDSYTYVDVSDQDVQLNAGQTYVIAAYWTRGPYTNWWDNDIQYSSVFTPNSLITLQQLDLMRTGQGVPVDLGNTSNTFLAANFQFELANEAPVAEAGANVTIQSADQAQTVLEGSANDADGDALQYRWLEGENVLQDWAPVVDGAAPLDLGDMSTLPLGSHTLKLEVNDGTVTSSDTMVLTVLNTPPQVVVDPASQTVEAGVGAIALAGTVADFDADSLSYRWVKNGVELATGTVDPPTDGGPWEVLGLTFGAGDTRFPVGTHQVTLEVSDGSNPPVVKTAEVIVVDSRVPTLAPVSSVSMLWPPDHTLRPVTVTANAFDSSGGAITLAAAVQCNEDDGGAEPDWTTPVIDNARGEISLSLRAERAGKGSGRVYTIRITATDASGNPSSAEVQICVPHDRRKN